MWKNSAAKVARALAVLRFGLLVLIHAGLRTALGKLGHQVYGRSVFLTIVRPVEIPRPAGLTRCAVVQATPEEVGEFFKLMHGESREGRYQLLVRRWFHEHGFGDCYITWTADTNEMCCIRWIVTAEDIERVGWQDRFPTLRDDDVMTENTYVLRRFRRRGYQESSSHALDDIFKRQGFKRKVGFVEKNNLPQLQSSRKWGNVITEKAIERHFLFQVRRRTVERYDPPIPIPIPAPRGRE